MNYKQTIDYLYSQLPVFQRIGAAAYKADLNNTLLLSGHLGNPEKRFRSIHIAGTNGKGSVANMLCSILMEAGYKTGLCTSPHLRDFRERIRINGKMINKSFVIDFVKKNKDFFNVIKPSFFEMFVALTFEYFAEEKVDIAVIETGMGGRLDSTNIICPELSVITNIGLDHVAFLGNSLEKIAAEKAGIIKPNIPVIIGRYQPETYPVFTEMAEKNNSKLIYASENFDILESETFSRYNRFWLKIVAEVNGKTKSFISDQWGPYQTENIRTSLKAVDILMQNGALEISNKNISDGLKKVRKNTGFEGRWQIKGVKPKILFDTGHNIDGLSITMLKIKDIGFNKLHFVLGMLDDKDLNGTLNVMPKDAIYYFCRPDVPRGLNLDTLLNAANERNLNGKTYPSVRTALDSAVKNAKSDDLIFVGGSTFVVAEVI
ncbi:MAG: bifunctional folylpolyglutamate synthase/dihydrofolate synthase [Bacteroidota bacterium]